MRPRPDAAEKHITGASNAGRGVRFNEAAARCRGKTYVPLRAKGFRASFNEAAARCRGKTHLLEVSQAPLDTVLQ